LSRFARDGAPPPVRIPLAPPNLSDADRDAVVRALKRTDIAPGPDVGKLERAISARLGVPYAVALSSGTAAVHLGLLVSGVQRDDDVLMPTLTYVAPANAVRHAGAHPVLLDAEPEFRQLDAGRARAYVERNYERADGQWRERRTGRRLGALLAVDLLGHPSDLDELDALAADLEIAFVDDAAEALGASVRGRAVGGIAPVSALSFNANKVITGAGGGMLLCHDEAQAELARSLSTHAKRAGSPLYLHDQVGFNYAMTAPQAALALSQLTRFATFLARKREVAARYAEALAGEPVTVPGEASWATASFWLYTVHVAVDRRTAVMAAFTEQGIACRPIFEVMHRVQAHAGAQADACPVAEELADTGLCLPCSTLITDAEVDEVAEALGAALRARTA
jgi:perosamine synthetase